MRTDHCVCFGRSCFLRSRAIAANRAGLDFATGKIDKKQAISALCKIGFHEDEAKKMIKESRTANGQQASGVGD